MQDSHYSNFQYKACTPEQTIHKIRNILNDIGIFTIENQWFEIYGKHLSSVQVAIFDNFKVATAGKGINRKYALASGLAEFLERIQNLQFTRVINSCRGTDYSDYPDTVEVDINDLKYLKYLLPEKDIEDVGKDEIKHYVRNGKMKAVPFYNLFEDRIDYIPVVLLALRCGSNGMCAGNTAPEAIIQGICEIFEREILYKIYFEDQSFPTIPEKYLQTLPVWHHIQNFKTMGIEVEVKDCTLEGHLPVVGVIFSKNNMVNFCAGSAPDFNIALERCFTEIFQGNNLNTFNGHLYRKQQVSKDNAYLHYLGALKSHSGALPDTLLIDRGGFDEKNLFWSRDLTSEVTLSKLIARIKNMGLQLLIRDVSFLGLPTYFIYIPGLSERVFYRPINLKLQNNLYLIKETLFNLKESSNEDIEFLADFIEEKYLEAKKTNTEFYLLKALDIPFKENASFNLTAIEVFLAVLYGRIGSYEKALNILKLFSAEIDAKSDKAKISLSCFIDIIERLKQGSELSEISNLLTDKYSRDCIRENIFLLEPSIDIGKVFAIPKRAEECSSCDVCYYKEFKELAQKIEICMKKYHFNQMALKDVIYYQ